jgi:hypothetical protein
MQPKLKIQWYHREMIKLVGYMRIRSMREIHASCYPGARYKYYITFTLINLNHIDHADTKNHGAENCIIIEKQKIVLFADRIDSYILHPQFITNSLLSLLSIPH